ncbi:MAG: class I SAM-dependent methyltransferase [Chloroflexota bacterium]
MSIDDKVWQRADLSNTYLEGVRGAIPLAHEQIDIMLRLIKAAQPSPKIILDLGCGDGILGHNILKQFPETTAVFVDFSETMLNAAKQRNSCFANTLFLEIDYGDANWVSQLNSHFQAEPNFSAVVSGFSIHHQPDLRKKKIYKEIFDSLASGGIFINIEHVASPTQWIESQFESLFIDSLFAYQQNMSHTQSRADVATEFYNRPDKQANILASVTDQCRWLHDIGYDQVDTYLKVFELAVFGGIKPNDD